MPITTHWYDEEHRVVANTFEGEWTWEELSQALVEMSSLAKSVPHHLVLFTDMSKTSFAPQGNILAQGKSSVRRVPGNVTQIVIVIQSRLLEVFAGLVFDMLPAWRNRVRFAKTYEEGQRLVAEAIAKNSAQSGG